MDRHNEIEENENVRESHHTAAVEAMQLGLI